MNYKKIIFVLSFLVILSFLFNFNVPSVKAITVAELQALIQQLQRQIVQLQQQLAEMQAAPAVWCHNFNINLRYGDKGTEVKSLQTALAKETFDVSGDTSGSFGDFTASAVVGFQEKYKDEILTPWKLTRGTGYVGQTTRAKLNKLYGCEAVVPLPVEKPSITVLSPNGGEIWVGGQTYTITWQSSVVSRVKIAECAETPLLTTKYTCHELSGIPDVGISATLGKFSWYVDPNDPFIPGQVKIKIWDVSNSSIYDKSDNYFSIVSATTMVTCARETTKAGVTCGGYFYEDYCENLADGTGYAAKRKCNAAAGTNCSGLVNVDRTFCSYGCQSGVCKPKPSITVISPSGGAQLALGTRYTITWLATGLNTVNIVLLDGRGGWSYRTIATNVSASQGTYSWTVPTTGILPGTTNPFKIWIGEYTPPAQNGDWEPLKATANSMTYGESASFSIQGEYVQVNRPGGEILTLGNTHYITWLATGLNTVNIVLLDGRGGWSYRTIATNVSASQGTYSWTVPTTGILPGTTNPFKIWIGEYTPPAQNGDWEPLKATANSMTYGESASFSIQGELGLENLEQQLASISNAISYLADKIKELLK